MPITPITLNGQVTLSVDGTGLMTVESGHTATVSGDGLAGQYRSGDPQTLTIPGPFTMTSGTETHSVPEGKDGVIAGPGLGIP